MEMREALQEKEDAKEQKYSRKLKKENFKDLILYFDYENFLSTCQATDLQRLIKNAI